MTDALVSGIRGLLQDPAPLSVSQMVDLDACLDGDGKAWDAFVSFAAPLILAAVRRTLALYQASRDAGQVEDLAQDVFVRLVRNDFRLLGTYDASRASLSTWLTLVARSTTIDHLRRRKPSTVPLDEAHPRLVAADAGPDAATEELDLPPGLLSPRQHLIIQLLFSDGLSVTEAANALGVEPQTVRSTKHKAISKLRRFYGAS